MRVNVRELMFQRMGDSSGSLRNAAEYVVDEQNVAVRETMPKG